MQVILSKNIIGYSQESGEARLHASKGDLLDVILRNKTHFICDSINYPETWIVVFPSQCAEILTEEDKEDEFSPEKYYNIYEEPYTEEVKNKLNNDLSDPEELEY